MRSPLFIALLVLASLCYSEGVAEFCAKFTSDESYELILTKNIEIPQNRKWNIPDSVSTGHCSFWIYNYFIDAPQSIEEDEFDLFMRKGGHICISTDHDETKGAVEPLKRELVKGTSYLGYTLTNAKESLKKYYGKKLKGKWTASLNESGIELSSNFLATITGECPEDSNIVEFCFRSAKDSSIELEIKRNIEIDLLLSEINKYIEYSDMWFPQLDLHEIYEVDFPKEWNCKTLLPLWHVRTFDGLQDYFSKKMKTKLSDYVKHKCEIRKKKIDERELDGAYQLEIRKKLKNAPLDSHVYQYTKKFKAKVRGRCSDGKQ